MELTFVLTFSERVDSLQIFIPDQLKMSFV